MTPIFSFKIENKIVTKDIPGYRSLGNYEFRLNQLTPCFEVA